VLGGPLVSPVHGGGGVVAGAPGRARRSGAARTPGPARTPEPGLARMSESALARARLSDVVLPRTRVGEIQRSRLLTGAVIAIDELGYPRATVGRITARARLSRRTFYQMFANRDECFAAVLEELAATVGGDLSAAGLEGLPWRERVRMGVWRILTFFDREPVLARVCVVQALRAGPLVLERREAVLAQLAALVDDGRLEGGRGEGCTSLTAEGLIGAAFAIVYARLARGESEPLTGLLGELMAMIVLPYLGPAAARRERSRPAPALPAVATRTQPVASWSARDPLADVNLRLTHRTARVLEGIAELSGRGSDPSNREVATFAGVTDPGQISKLLRRLERLGLLVNTGAGHAKGEPNAWALTDKGQSVTHSICMHARDQREAA
jgi:AcrR family transcriptional regulator